MSAVDWQKASATNKRKIHMGRELMTPLGKKAEKNGNDVIDSLDASIKYTHDVFLLASQEKMNVWMTCGSLTEWLRDRHTRLITGVTFAQSVREVIDVGRNVSILLWNSLELDQPFSRELAKL